MCAGGVPIQNKTNALDCINAAIAMQRYMKNRYENKIKNGAEYWQMRIGIHTGPLVAGVVGKNKFLYDIWGDTVNTAARMEEASEISMINISKETYNIVSPFFTTKYRGELPIKNKGKVEMHEVIY